MRHRSLPSTIKICEHHVGLRIARSAAPLIFAVFLLGCSTNITSKLPLQLRPSVSESGAHLTKAARVWRLHYISTYSFLPGHHTDLNFTRHTKQCGSRSIVLSVDNRIVLDALSLQGEICKTINLVESSLDVELPISNYRVILVDFGQFYEQTYAKLAFNSVDYEVATRYSEPGTGTAGPVAIIAHELVHAALRFKNGQIRSASEHEREEFIASLFSKCAEIIIHDSVMFLPVYTDVPPTISSRSIAASVSSAHAVSKLAEDLGIALGTPISSASKEARDFIQACERYGFRADSRP